MLIQILTYITSICGLLFILSITFLPTLPNSGSWMNAISTFFFLAFTIGSITTLASWLFGVEITGKITKYLIVANILTVIILFGYLTASPTESMDSFPKTDL